MTRLPVRIYTTLVIEPEITDISDKNKDVIKTLLENELRRTFIDIEEGIPTILKISNIPFRRRRSPD